MKLLPAGVARDVFDIDGKKVITFKYAYRGLTSKDKKQIKSATQSYGSDFILESGHILPHKLVIEMYLNYADALGYNKAYNDRKQTVSHIAPTSDCNGMDWNLPRKRFTETVAVPDTRMTAKVTRRNHRRHIELILPHKITVGMKLIEIEHEFQVKNTQDVIYKAYDASTNRIKEYSYESDEVIPVSRSEVGQARAFWNLSDACLIEFINWYYNLMKGMLELTEKLKQSPTQVLNDYVLVDGWHICEECEELVKIPARRTEDYVCPDCGKVLAKANATVERLYPWQEQIGFAGDHDYLDSEGNVVTPAECHGYNGYVIPFRESEPIDNGKHTFYTAEEHKHLDYMNDLGDDELEEDSAVEHSTDLYKEMNWYSR